MSNINIVPDSRHSEYIYPLTSLRFFAAALVFILHADNHGLVSLAPFSFFDLSKAVSFFFLLSGFVLTYAYGNCRIYLPKFYISRFLRIWPITCLSLLLTLILLPDYIYLPGPVSQFSHGAVLLTNILCIQSLIPIPSFYFAFNAVAWSVSVELIFYALFPYLTVLSFRALTKILFLNITFVVIFLFLSVPLPFYPTSPHLYDQIMLHGLFYINPGARLPEFILGILTCKLFQSNLMPFVRERINSIFLHSRILVILGKSLGSLLCFLLVLIALSAYLPIGIPYDSAKLILSQFKSGIFFSLFILVLLTWPSYLSSFLSSRLFLVLGETSFSFYLFHQLFLIKSSQLGGIVLFGIQILPPNIVVVFLWSLSVSFITYYCFEKPFKYHLSQKIFGFLNT